jgi:carbamoyltransferase
MKTLYLGPTYDLSHIEGLDVTYEQVASLISDRNIVAMFQGRSEAGPRALGNRSILYDPRDPNGKDHVNTIKKREAFRPFAGTILKEYVHEWFDMAGLEESPFMMYAVDALEHTYDIIPAILHVDNTCRVQTVTKEQNDHYYNLIEAFYDLTKVPILFNTSFNLAGEPLVETPEDAMKTFYTSDIKYLYFPEVGKLVTK